MTGSNGLWFAVRSDRFARRHRHELWHADWLDPWPVLALGAELPDLLGCFRIWSARIVAVMAGYATAKFNFQR